MIHVDRHTIPVPQELTNPMGKAMLEKEQAKLHFTSASKNEKFDFCAYNSDEVKIALKKLFNGKCAYCESPILTVTVGDIEHFRPKAAIVTDKKKMLKPGYYWLAADWDNLLLSCNNCNRKITQEEFEGGAFTMGKANQFPIDDERARCKSHTGDLAKEEKVRLLINPCTEDPEEYLEYLDNGAIKAKNQPDRFKIKKAEQSISVYALLRDPLVKERAKLVKDIQYHISVLLSTREEIVKAKKAGIKPWEDSCYERLMQTLDKLSQYIAPDQPYSAIAKQFIQPILQENGLY
ncbi:TIGR02646 family protein [Pseudoflavitalea sp. X16]|uniref:retron system putative HNH endonuclease n=1 Tax=Paraflavitalea devenefica TaxID=2716334 RepID=UPI00141F1E5A|nr:retron system putative HNH endonuclease [Paraflavitalea devenefica]NII25181.1 TIGR02646 family protein [Paraflavitalea devenefica]